MVQPSLMRFQFDEFQLDQQRILLRFRGESLAIRPKVFDLLVLLVRHRTRVVPREELVLALWGTTVVGSGSLSGLINELRRVLCESERGASLIRTVHARGYQFVGEVEFLAVDSLPTARESTADARHGVDAEIIDGVRACFDRVTCSGARAVLLNPSLGSSRSTSLLESAAALLRESGFETIEALESGGLDEPQSPLVDRLIESLVDHYGIAVLRSKIPVRAHEIFEHRGQQRSTGGDWFSEPLAAQQYQGRRLRGMVSLLQSLARERPIGFVIDRAPSAGDENAATLSALLNLLDKSHVFVVGLRLPVCRYEGSESLDGRDDPRIDVLPLPRKSLSEASRMRRVDPVASRRRAGSALR